MVGMRKRSILTALVTASLAVSLAACGETDTAHSYTTPKDTKTVYLPYEASGVLSSLGGIKELLKQS